MHAWKTKTKKRFAEGKESWARGSKEAGWHESKSESKSESEWRQSYHSCFGGNRRNDWNRMIVGGNSNAEREGLIARQHTKNRAQFNSERVSIPKPWMDGLIFFSTPNCVALHYIALHIRIDGWVGLACVIGMAQDRWRLATTP